MTAHIPVMFIVVGLMVGVIVLIVACRKSPKNYSTFDYTHDTMPYPVEMSEFETSSPPPPPQSQGAAAFAINGTDDDDDDDDENRDGTDIAGASPAAAWQSASPPLIESPA